MQISPFCFSFCALKYQLNLLLTLSQKGNFNSKAGKTSGKAIAGRKQGQTGNVQCPWQITHHIIFPLHWRHTHSLALTHARNGWPGISETVAAARIPRRITYAWSWQDEKDEEPTKAAAPHREWRKCLDRRGKSLPPPKNKRKTSNTSQAVASAPFKR